MSTPITPRGGSPCFICDEQPTDLRKLKTHLLLKHSKMNLCLFCVENKVRKKMISNKSYNMLYNYILKDETNYNNTPHICTGLV